MTSCELLTSLATIVVAAPITAGPLHTAQNGTDSARPSFEVASIKPSDPTDRGMFIRFEPGGRYVTHGMSVKSLIENAYDLHDFQISGGPGWLDSAKYDILAKTETGELSHAKECLQSLLADRFQFKFHISAKEHTIYALSAAKDGPKLERVNDSAGGGVRVSMGMTGGELTSDGLSMSLLAANLSNIVGHIVQDRTGPGLYKVHLKWNPDHVETRVGGPGADDASDRPAIFTALREQLGLKLEPAKGSVDVYVIDQIERPSEN